MGTKHSKVKINFSKTDPVTSATSDDEDNEFYDAQEEGASIASQEDNSFILKIPLSARRNSNDATGSSSEGEEPKSETQQVKPFLTKVIQKIFNAHFSVMCFLKRCWSLPNQTSTKQWMTQTILN